MLAVNQIWDPLEVCIVGKMYDPDYFKTIDNTRVRKALEKIAIGCEEDLQKLIQLLHHFNVTVIRPNSYTTEKFIHPLIMPRDHTAMIGNKFFMDPRLNSNFIQPIVDYVKSQGTEIIWKKNINTACILRLGRDLLVGNVDLSKHNLWTSIRKDNWPIDPPNKINESFNSYLMTQYKNEILSTFQTYRCHFYDDECHLDGRLFIPKEGLLITNPNLNHKNLFKNWDVLEFGCTIKDDIENDPLYLQIKEKNKSKWWVKGEEYNNDFIDYVNTYLDKWLGYIEESQFALNILMIDPHNAVVSNINDKIARKLQEHGITLHHINFRYSLFFDGGIHCLTSDIKRKGELIDLALPSKEIV